MEFWWMWWEWKTAGVLSLWPWQSSWSWLSIRSPRHRWSLLLKWRYVKDIDLIFWIRWIAFTTFVVTAGSYFQALQLLIKEIQAKHDLGSSKDIKQEMSELYQCKSVNLFIGIFSTIVEIPIFVELYQAIVSLVVKDKLNKPFIIVLSHQGPTYGADKWHGSDWVLTRLVHRMPSLGSSDTMWFFALPIWSSNDYEIDWIHGWNTVVISLEKCS